MNADSLRQSKRKKKCKAVSVERIQDLQMSFFQFHMPRSVLNSPKSNFPSPFGSAASIISCVQENREGAAEDGAGERDKQSEAA